MREQRAGPLARLDLDPADIAAVILGMRAHAGGAWLVVSAREVLGAQMPVARRTATRGGKATLVAGRYGDDAMWPHAPSALLVRDSTCDAGQEHSIPVRERQPERIC
jgi:hypothetical protein